MVGGLNNVRHETTDKIVKEFADTVLAQSQEHHPDTLSTFATLFLPPQYTRFLGDKAHLSNYFQNKLDMMMDFNDKIKLFNNTIYQENIDVFKAQNGSVAGEKPTMLGLHKYGIRKLNKKFPSGKVVPLHTHRFEQWRETEREQMLHLNADQRAKAGRAINNFFINQFVPRKIKL